MLVLVAGLGREMMEARDSSRHAEAIETGIARCGQSQIFYFQLKIAAEGRPCSFRHSLGLPQ